MAQGHLTQLVQRAKELLVTDPFWWRSFKEKSNTLDDVILQAGGKVSDKKLATSAAILAKLELVSRWTGPNKVVDVTVTPTSESLQSSKFFTSSTRKVLQEFFNETDWAKQRGSDSPVEAITKDLRRAVKAAGGKVSGPVAAIRKSGKAKADIRRGELVHKLTGKEQTELDLSVLSLLNARLPPAVRSNMGEGGALVNRTGRFSESVRIVGVEQTPQGFPRLLYTYQRAPYDVFDPVIGALPWATPGRDPKILIDKSIRDVARDMAIGRFYTRRS